MLTETLLQNQRTSSITVAQLIRQFGAGLTFSSHVFEDCSVYSAEDANGVTKLILHNRSPQAVAVSMKFVNVDHKEKGELIALNHDELVERSIEFEIDENMSIEVPAESVYLIMIPAQ
jgi:hypothetical protein